MEARRYDVSETRRLEAGTSPSLIHWRPIFGGAVVALGIQILFTSLWLAIAYGSNSAYMQDRLNWWIGGTAIVALFIGGLVSAWTHSVRGVTAGLLNSLTLWGLLTIAAVVIGLPAAVNLVSPSAGTVGAARVTTSGLGTSFYWTAFWSILIALGSSLLGGVIGGVMPRRYRGGMRTTAVEEGGTIVEHERRPRRAV